MNDDWAHIITSEILTDFEIRFHHTLRDLTQAQRTCTNKGCFMSSVEVAHEPTAETTDKHLQYVQHIVSLNSWMPIGS